MTTVNQSELRLSAQRALIYSIPRRLRNLSLEVRGKTLVLRAYFSSEPTEDDRDLLFAASGEIEGDFPELDSSSGVVEFIVDDGPIDGLDTLRWVVFSLSE